MKTGANENDIGTTEVILSSAGSGTQKHSHGNGFSFIIVDAAACTMTAKYYPGAGDNPQAIASIGDINQWILAGGTDHEIGIFIGSGPTAVPQPLSYIAMIEQGDPQLIGMPGGVVPVFLSLTVVSDPLFWRGTLTGM